MPCKEMDSFFFTNMTSRVLNDKLNTNFESYSIGIFNGQQSARGSGLVSYKKIEYLTIILTYCE